MRHRGMWWPSAATSAAGGAAAMGPARMRVASPAPTVSSRGRRQGEREIRPDRRVPLGGETRGEVDGRWAAVEMGRKG
jgi:hypothetical protein